MRSVFLLLSALALGTAFTGTGGADNATRAERPAVKLPDYLTCSVVRNDHLYAVTQGGKLIDVDLKERQIKELNLGDAKLIPSLDVAGGKALVASKEQMHLIDLATGKCVRSINFTEGIQGLGFVGDDRAFIKHGTSVSVVDLTNGKTRHAIDLGQKEKSYSGGLEGYHKVGQRLFATSAPDNGLAIIDLESGKLLEMVKAETLKTDSLHWIGSVHVTGDRAFVVCWRYGYGVWTDSVGCIDLKAKKYTALRVPRMDHGGARPSTLVAGPDGTVFLTGEGCTCQLNAEGKVIGQSNPKMPGRLVGIWNGQALVVGHDALQFAPVAEAIVKAE